MTESTRPLRIYVASSWKNEKQPYLVAYLRQLGHEVYDFRDPHRVGGEGEPVPAGGFSWSPIDPDWRSWTPEMFRRKVKHPIAKKGFGLDLDAMKWADCGVILLPCGNDAHLQAGWFAGARKPCALMLDENFEPGLMYNLLDDHLVDLAELESWCANLVVSD